MKYFGESKMIIGGILENSDLLKPYCDESIHQRLENLQNKLNIYRPFQQDEDDDQFIIPIDVETEMDDLLTQLKQTPASGIVNEILRNASRQFDNNEPQLPTGTGYRRINTTGSPNKSPNPLPNFWPSAEPPQNSPATSAPQQGKGSGTSAQPYEPPRSPQATTGAEPPAEAGDEIYEKTINAWIPALEKEKAKSVQQGKKYDLCFNVGDPVAESFLEGEDAKISLAEIPEEGLNTEWVVTSTKVKIEPCDSSVRKLESERGYTVAFDMLIPREGESSTIKIAVTPEAKKELLIDIHIYATKDTKKELYRKLQVKLPTGKSTKKLPKGVVIQNELILAPASQLNLRTTHEWTTPPGELKLIVNGNGNVLVNLDSFNKEINQTMVWPAAPPFVAGPMKNLVATTNTFRAKWDDYLNDLDGEDVIQRLKNFNPNYEWNNLMYTSDAAHDERWAKVSTSPELYNVLYDAYTLYDTFFPTGTELRKLMDELPPGTRIDIHWTSSAASALPHVPWGLLYVEQPDRTKPVDGNKFMGIRFRISYMSQDNQGAAKSLGKLDDVYSANLLYWGEEPGDPVYEEVSWQQKQKAGWQKQINVPAQRSSNARNEVMSMLDQPTITPLAMIYLYCHCTVDDGNNPVLQFGDTTEDIIKRTELGMAMLKDRPLVFANACTTSKADAYMANELEMNFFRRGARGYIGTEIKVPIRFASRFAYIFFNFFYRKVDPAPMAAGEAIAQTRLWLWTNYRNIGGLFYSYFNQYELFMADAEELKNMKR